MKILRWLVEGFEWNEKKSKLLKITRGISFEDIALLIIEDRTIAILDHYNKRYENQKIFIVEYNNYVYIVPYVQDGLKIFLKTIIPSRKFTRKYLKNDK